MRSISTACTRSRRPRLGHAGRTAVRGCPRACDLVTSVRVWLEHDRQTERAARALHIHPNTLLYRIRRFEQVSGRSLGSTESLAEVWLALRATAAVPDVAHRPAPA
jgi:hypothetical protein